MSQRIDVFVLELGGNDVLRGIPVSVSKSNLQGIIDKTSARYPEADIVLAGMQAPPNLGDEYLAAFKAMYPELASSNNAALIPFLLEGVAGNPELNLPDRIHPTEQGHRIIAETVWPVLQPLLEKRL
jgi:acyl-CoA thioesterase-1